jgi:tetratricopeptide (TPR) repeat protein
MKKMKWLFAVIFAFLCAAAVSAEPVMIDFSKFPADSELRRDITALFEKEKMFRIWIADDLWKFDVTKDQVAESVLSVFTRVDQAVIDGWTGIDLRLYRAMLMHYLYNLEQEGYHQDIVASLEELKKEFPRDYRPYWILGIHYSQAALPLDAIKEYENVIGKIPEDKISPFLWDDYAAAASAAGMPIRAVAAFETAARLRGESLPESNGYYMAIKKKLKKPEDAVDLKEADITVWEEAGDDYEVYSRPFGIRFPLRSAWKIKTALSQNSSYTLAAKSENITSVKGNTITYSLLLLCQAKPTKDYEYFKSGFMKSGGTMKKASLEDIDPRWEVFEAWDPSLYKNIGGMHGYIAFLRATEPKLMGFKLERPRSPPKSGVGGVYYYPLKDVLLRYGGEIYYTVLLDTCEEIFQKSQNDFLEFLRGTVIE